MIRELVNPKLPVRPNQPPTSAPGYVYGVRFTTDGKFVVGAGGAPRGGGYLAVWNAADGSLVSAEELPAGTFFALALSPDDKFAAVGTAGRGGPAGQEVNSSFLMRLPPGK